MTNATTGLHRALGRSASAVAVAVADLKADDLIAQMTDEQKAAMSAHFALDADASGNAPDEQTEGEGGDAEGSEVSAASAGTFDPRAKVLAKAVATTDACKGKADAALNLLADEDFAGLSASALVKMVASAPATSNPDSAAREEMRAALSQNRNSNIDADAGSNAAANAAADAAGIWGRATARVFPEARK